MTVFVGSRYAGQQVIVVEQADGTTAPAVLRTVPVPAARFHYYQVTLGDRLDLIAAKFLGDPLKWWMIADANPQIFYPGNIQAGTMLRIPSA